MKTDFYVEFNGKKTDQKAILEKIKDIWRSEGNRIKDLSSVEAYFKPEEQKCYYIINDDSKGSFEI
ncbi:MAG: DUF6465 family protein [Clostridiales bacterium]|nr:DUF6465 family protein [Clostridiales bacterium]